MRIEHLQYFVDVTETGSISKSAEKIFISQQGLSQAIQHIERQLGVELFYREGNKLFQTEAGKLTEQIARDVIDKYNELIILLKPYIQTNTVDTLGEMTIYSNPIINETICPKVISLFHRKYHHIEIRVMEKKTSDIADSVRNTPNSIGVLSLPLFELGSHVTLDDIRITFEEMYRCKLMASVAKSSPLAAKTCISNEDLLENPLSLFNVEKKFLKYLFDGKEKPHVMIRTSNLYLAKKTVEEGITIGFTNKFVDKFFGNLSVVSIPLEKDIDMIFGIVSPRNIPKNSPLRELLNILKREFKT